MDVTADFRRKLYETHVAELATIYQRAAEEEDRATRALNEAQAISKAVRYALQQKLEHEEKGAVVVINGQAYWSHDGRLCIRPAREA